MSDTEDKQLNEGASGQPEEVPATATSDDKEVAPADDSEQADPVGRAASPKAENGDSDAAEAKESKPNAAATKKEKSKATAKADDESDEAYRPGDSVQVKIPGYPWWPAVVVTPEHFPAAALAARPTMKTRKDGSSAVSYPVQFLGTPEYYWSRSTDIKALSSEDVKAWIESGKKSSTKGLKAAYQHAQKKPSLEELMEAKTNIEAQQVDEDEDMPDEDDEAAEEDVDEDDIDLDDEGKPIKKSKSKKKATARTPKKTPSKTPTKKRKTDVDEDEPRPSTKKSRATPKASAKRNSSPKQESTSSPREPSSPLAEQPELSPEEAAEQSFKQKKDGVMWLRHRLQKCLLGEKCVEDMLDDIPSWLDRLDPIDVDVRLLRETKIGKVLVRIRRLESIPRDEELGIKAHCSKLLEKWREAMEALKKLETEEAAHKSGAAAKDNGAEPTGKETATNGHESSTNGNTETASGEAKKEE